MSPHASECTASAAAYLVGSGLPDRWQRGGRFVVLDTGFGNAERFFACWKLWRETAAPADPPSGGGRSGAAPRQLCFLAIAAPCMPNAETLRARWAATAARCGTPINAASASASTPPRAMADGLLAVWPPAVPGLHRLAFDEGSVQLLVASGGVRSWLPQMAASVDAFFIDAATLSEDGDPSWPLRLFKAAGRLAASGATLAIPVAGDAPSSALRTAGFRRVLAVAADEAGAEPSGPVGSALVQLWHTRYTPDFAARRTVRRGAAASASPSTERQAVIVGAGLAGCATAWALAEHGWHSTLLDRHPAPAAEASGNPGGLFHGVIHPQDGAHARFNRAAALEAQRAVRIAIDHHGVAGASDGLLQLHVRANTSASTVGLADLQAIVDDSGLPADYVRAVDAREATALAGMRIAGPCLFYPGGGWVRPAGLARSFVERGGSRICFRGNSAVAALRRIDTSAAVRARWQLLDAAGRVLGESEVVVLANAGSDEVFIGEPAAGGTGFPAGSAIEQVRGQLSQLPVDHLKQAIPELVLPKLPLTGAGWLLPAVDGWALFGATAQPGDPDAAVRLSDHEANFAALARLTGLAISGGAPLSLTGRTAWRCVTRDRLPLIGAVVANDRGNVAASPASRQDDPHDDRFDGLLPAASSDGVRRLAGLYTFSGLGSRGITWAALGGQVLASLIVGSPVPLARGLIEAVDPGRFVVRQRRRRPHR